ncbi:prolyl oligopeptidase family serine peptidase [Streptomyces sp. NBC_00539]|uniref:prolyl oligopeptidase family serine peptidase n=1 Tax=Streptomyces sp. NBC_00539 TaxID=2975770 RepID=UPI002E818774|nr:prolyl oligopeptidase family serine peptidase [Streptomyces sp. NBC_00539]WUC68531.1 prolyl oligopeptidase family serine peptidase [Streptomyces sp. NBC_00539]
MPLDRSSLRRRSLPAPAQAPVPVHLAPVFAADPPTLLTAHGCWYPSVDPGGDQVAYICDRAGVPQLWSGSARGGEAHVLDADPDPVTEVSWSPDGRWIAYTSAPGGGEHTRVLVVRPDGTGRRVLAGAEPGAAAHLGCWTRDGAALAVTVAQPSADAGAHSGAGHLPEDASPGPADGTTGAAWTERDGHATLLGPPHRAEPGPYANGLPHLVPAPPAATADGAASGGLAAYLLDPDGTRAPVLLFSEAGAASLRVCDVGAEGRFVLLRRGPRGRREALLLDAASGRTTFRLPVADGDPWIGRLSADSRTLWLRSDADREFAALLRARLDGAGALQDLSVAAERHETALDLLSLPEHGGWALLAWNVHGASELETVGLPTADPDDGLGPHHRSVLPHEVVTRMAPVGRGGLFAALSGSRRRPGIWDLTSDFAPVRTGWSARDEDAAPPGRPPVSPVPLRCRARDGLMLGGWYYRAPERDPGRPAPCVIHLHGGPEEQERPVFNPLYHELLTRGMDVFAPDVRGSSGWGRSFVDADLGTGRFAAIDDVADCAAHVVTHGYADPLRLAVMGRSYGGYLTMASLVWHPDLFRTGVAVCGMSDLATFFAGTEPWIAQSAAAKYGHPERDRDLLRDLSPMSRIDQLRAPVLAVHGEHDTNVPPTESEQFVRAARERGVPAELLTLRNEGHEFLRADNRRLYRRAAADWLEQHLGSAALPRS